MVVSSLHTKPIDRANKTHRHTLIIHIGRERERERDRQTRQTDRQTETQAERQTEREHGCIVYYMNDPQSPGHMYMHTRSVVDVIDELVSFVIAPLLISKAFHSSHSQKATAVFFQVYR